MFTDLFYSFKFNTFNFCLQIKNISLLLLYYSQYNYNNI